MTELSGDEQRSNEHKSAPRGWVDRIDDMLLNLLLALLIIGTLGVFGLDARTLLFESSREDWNPHQERLEPMPMRIAMPDDHIRPYLPRTRPMLSRSARVRMPGFAEPVPSAMLAEGMVFRVGDDGRMSAVGRIGPGTAQALEEFVAVRRREAGEAGEADAIREVHLHSPGGVVTEALRMARFLRDQNISTHVPDNGYCASSCPLVLAGGVTRSAGKSAWIGVHQIFADQSTFGTIQQGMREAQLISAQAQSHLEAMGVDSKAWLHAMVTPKEKLYLFTRQQLVDYRWISSDEPDRRRRG